ncbi:MAG: hypothetical protein GY870_14110 [archaeon]|nr:hypothetical protein [archaeon]
MIKICEYCFEFYHKLTNFDVCPKINCSGDVHEIDDMIVETMVTLWKKGINTNYCCSGHISEPNFQCYIMFNDPILQCDDIPVGFEIINDPNIILQLEIKEEFWCDVPYHERQKILIDTNLKLYEWSKKITPYQVLT